MSKPFHDVEGGQRRDSLRIRRALPDGGPAVARTDGIVPVAAMRGEIRGGQEPAVRLYAGRDPFRDRPFVEGAGSALGEYLQGPPEGGKAHDLAEPRRAAVEQQLPAGRLAGELPSLFLPDVSDHFRDCVAVEGEHDGRLQHVRKTHAAMAFQQGRPSRRRCRERSPRAPRPRRGSGSRRSRPPAPRRCSRSPRFARWRSAR